MSNKVYLAGPMRGYAEFNFPAFREAARVLREQGCDVFSPAERDISIGFDPKGMAGDHAELGPAGFSLREALAADLEYVCLHADMVVVLPGWEKSAGAAAEVAAARALDIPVQKLSAAPATATVQVHVADLPKMRVFLTAAADLARALTLVPDLPEPVMGACERLRMALGDLGIDVPPPPGQQARAS